MAMAIPKKVKDLLEMLRQAFNITIGGLNPLPQDGKGVDVSLIFNTIRRKVMEQRGWDVIEQAILGSFSFNKFILWNDIHNNSDILCQNKTSGNRTWPDRLPTS